MTVKGNKSVRNLHVLLCDKFGDLAFKMVGGINDETDTIGWKMQKVPRFLFSVSTLAGELPLNIYDLEISISDESMENGEIVFNSDVKLEQVPELIEDVIHGKIT